MEIHNIISIVLLILLGIAVVGSIVYKLINANTNEETKSALLGELKKLVYALLSSILTGSAINLNMEVITTWVLNQLPDFVKSAVTDDEINKIIQDGYDIMVNKIVTDGDLKEKVTIDPNDVPEVSKIGKFDPEDIELFDEVYDGLQLVIHRD